MVNKRVRCPYCASLRTKKKGKQSNRKRYGCKDYGKRFQLERRGTKVINEIWNAYTRQKQALQELADLYGRSHVWVRKQLDSIEVPFSDVVPQATVIIADTTFWGRQYGVMVSVVGTQKEHLVG